MVADCFYDKKVCREGNAEAIAGNSGLLPLNPGVENGLGISGLLKGHFIERLQI